MKVGVALNMLQKPGLSDAAVFAEHMALGDLAEPLGFDSLWALEHHFTGYAMSPAPTQLLAYFAGRTRRVALGTAVIVLSQHVETEHLFELLAGDARGIGYVLKERVADIAQFTGAIRRVAAGESVIDPQVVARLVARPRQDSPLQTLTERELAVLALMAEGRSNQAIAARMFLSDRAVERHVTAIFSKLGLTATPENHRRVLAVLTYLRA